MTPDSRDLQQLANEASQLLKALSHPARLMICCQLRGGEMSVSDIEETLGIKQPNLSRELAKLRDDGIVTTRRESKVVIYRLTETTRAKAVVDALCAVMLGRETPAIEVPLQTVPSKRQFRPNRPGGYGVFARISKP